MDCMKEEYQQKAMDLNIKKQRSWDGVTTGDSARGSRINSENKDKLEKDYGDYLDDDYDDSI